MNDPAPLTLLAATALLLLFTGVASADGLYFHLYRYRLHLRPASRREHWLHTANALLFSPLTFLLFCVRPEGAYLWLALLLFLATVGVEVADVLCERRSRADLGGLTPLEYLLHFLMSGLRFGMSGPLLVADGAAGYGMRATALLPRPPWLLHFGGTVVIAGIGVAGLHVVLERLGRRQLLAAERPTTPQPTSVSPLQPTR